jgi:hypothetical protein
MDQQVVTKIHSLAITVGNRDEDGWEWLVDPLTTPPKILLHFYTHGSSYLGFEHSQLAKMREQLEFLETHTFTVTGIHALAPQGNSVQLTAHRRE